MLMNQCTANGEGTFAASGRLDVAGLVQFSEMLARACEGRGVVLRNCPPYARIWMASRGKPA